MSQAQALEEAILARAERLANEYRERGRRARDSILREAAEKLRLREQREEAIAKALGERTYRQQVQAEELRLQGHLDRMRWDLVSNVEAQLAGRLENLIADQAAWLENLRGLIVAAVTAIERDRLLVLANDRDRKLLDAHWETIGEHLPAARTVRLDTDPITTLGGVMVVSEDRRIRVDNTFEGRSARLRARLQQTIQERLLPSGYETGSIFGG
ncbi:MAG: ATPase [Chromatiaceae bacterium]|nr:MAG: ATPase [Chromatiaceae bacterium]